MELFRISDPSHPGPAKLALSESCNHPKVFDQIQRIVSVLSHSVNAGKPFDCVQGGPQIMHKNVKAATDLLRVEHHLLSR